MRSRTTPVPQAARRASSAAGIGGPPHNSSSTRRRAGVRRISVVEPWASAHGFAVGSAASPVGDAAQSRLGRGDCNASGTLIVMRSTEPGGAIV